MQITYGARGLFGIDLIKFNGSELTTDCQFILILKNFLSHTVKWTTSAFKKYGWAYQFSWKDTFS